MKRSIPEQIEPGPFSYYHHCVPRSEKLSPEQRKRVGYFVFHYDKWLLVNEHLPGPKDLSEDKAIPLRASIELRDGKWILLPKEEGGRMMMVQMVEA